MRGRAREGEREIEKRKGERELGKGKEEGGEDIMGDPGRAPGRIRFLKADGLSSLAPAQAPAQARRGPGWHLWPQGAFGGVWGGRV